MQVTRCQFVAKKNEDGTPWIALQGDDVEVKSARTLAGFELYAGASIEEAKQLARFLNNNIKSVARAS